MGILGRRTKVDGPSDRIGPYAIAAFAATAILFVGVGGWAATFNLAGAVLASGTVVVEGNIKKVQHPTGGIVGQIRVKDGDRVSAGDLLVRLDDTVARSNLMIVAKNLDELAIRQVRLKAEQSGAEFPEIPERLKDRTNEAEIKAIVEGERALFEDRRSGHISQKSQLQERIAQFTQEIEGLEKQLEGKSLESRLVESDLKGLEKLEDKGLVTTNRMTTTRRDLSRLIAERGQLAAQIAQAKGRISEIELQILQRDHEFRSEIVKELRDAQNKEAELIERRTAAMDQLQRIDILSPQAGTVHQLGVHTVGGVVNAGEPIMMIVPHEARLVIDSRVAQQNIAQVAAGHTAFLRFTAFDHRTTPELIGTVERVAPDLIVETQSNTAYYLARIEVPPSELRKLSGQKLVAGMPVEVQIKTTDRSALSYLMKPLEDQFARAFKER